MNSVKDEDDITVSEDPNGPKIGLEELKGPSGREGCETPRIQMVQPYIKDIRSSRSSETIFLMLMMKKREPWDGI